MDIAFCCVEINDTVAYIKRQNQDLTVFINDLSRSNRRDGVVVRASASQSVDLGFTHQVESHQKTLKNGIYSFPAWRSA